MPIVIDLMHAPALTFAHTIQLRNASPGPDRLTRIDRLDVPNFRKELELNEFVGQRALPMEESSGRPVAPAVDAKLGADQRALKRLVPVDDRDSHIRGESRSIVALTRCLDEIGL